MLFPQIDPVRQGPKMPVERQELSQTTFLRRGHLFHLQPSLRAMNDIPKSCTGCFQSLILYSSISNTYAEVTVFLSHYFDAQESDMDSDVHQQATYFRVYQEGTCSKKKTQTTTTTKTLQPRNLHTCRKININMSKHMETKTLSTILEGRLVIQDIIWKIFHTSLKSMLQKKINFLINKTYTPMRFPTNNKSTCQHLFKIFSPRWLYYIITLSKERKKKKESICDILLYNLSHDKKKIRFLKQVSKYQVLV